jgi:dihydroorotate dehydrogenase
MTGGLSGEPLQPLALRTVARLRATLGAGFCIIGVGGIHSPGSARAMLDAGAQLIQLYTSLIFQGPGLIGRIASSLADRTSAAVVASSLDDSVS